MSTPKSGANPRRLFPTAKEDAHAAKKVADSAQCRSASYRLAFQDPDFLLRDELRPIRLQLELLKPDVLAPGVDIHAGVSVFAEGCRGHLGKQLIERFSLDAGKDPQHYGLGIKEIWEIDPSKHDEGLVEHGLARHRQDHDVGTTPLSPGLGLLDHIALRRIRRQPLHARGSHRGLSHARDPRAL